MMVTNVLWKQEEKKERNKVKSNGDHGEFSKDSAKTT